MPEAPLPVATPELAPAPPQLELLQGAGVRAPTPPARRFDVAAYDLGSALALARELSVSPTLAQILVRRGLGDPAAARAFLAADAQHDPLAFAGIDTAVAAIRHHIERRSRIVVHGDYDVDGVCATAILVRALRSLGADVGFFLPSRLEDGYGISDATVAKLVARGVGLMITVDCGITAVEQVAGAAAAGLDVVVSDHHSARADGALPSCPIVHPVLGAYPCPELCGTGVSYKLAQALGATTADDDLELVALATVADLVPLVGENRRLVRTGLAALANTARPGLRALMEVSRVDPSALDAQTLGFRLAPRINAAGRMRRADAGLELLLTDDAARAREIALELDHVNAERRAVEQRITWEAEAEVAALGDRHAYVLAREGWHQGVVGIVASRIVERYHRPAILIALDGDQPGHGSGRSIPGFDLLGALHAAAGSLEAYGGHRAAAGLTVSPDRIETLREAVERHAETVLTPDLLEPVERIDAIVSGSELGLALAEELQLLEPCGLGNPSPQLLVPGARFAEVRRMGEEGRHARFSVISGGASARAVAFGCERTLGGDPSVALDATFKLERNVWNGAVEPRLVLRHSRPCNPGEIAVVGEPAAGGYVAAALSEAGRELPGAPATSGEDRRVVDRRGESPLAVLADAVSCSDSVLAVCADVARRLSGLAERTGGFTLVSYHALECDPGLASRYSSVVALDPPSNPAFAALVSAGSGFVHLAWGEAELRFAEQMHELEYGLRTSLVTLYRSLRQRQKVTGEELEQVLRGNGPHGRPARLAGRLVRVLAELGLVSLDRDLPALTLAGVGPTALERSPSFRVYATRYEDGHRYLNSANLRRSA
ncbi:MAG TPA: single-stranded-DNA-specific exonuclease RecJ [Solirubrobacteraceae bacterium]|nr:single-stranded-DNA-specific exonuclease RecJ [Solirubrobacteraceae bacterium]